MWRENKKTGGKTEHWTEYTRKTRKHIKLTYSETETAESRHQLEALLMETDVRVIQRGQKKADLCGRSF